MKCNSCEEELEEIVVSTDIKGATVWLSHREPAILLVCTSGDCKNCGVVICVPSYR
jgi:hypothetical protein